MTIPKKKIERPEIYVSVDVETDGPCPGLHSMLAIGCSACVPLDDNGDYKEISIFHRNLFPIVGAKKDPDTMKFWKENPLAYDAISQNRVDPGIAIAELDDWVNVLPGRPVFVAYPASFDFTFVYWYMHTILGHCSFGFSCLDLKSYACAITNKPFSKNVKSRFPRSWTNSEYPHDHTPLNDARGQAHMFFQMRAASLKKGK